MAVASTIGELRASGFPDKTVKEELRLNLIARLASHRRLFPSIVGYEGTVIPTLERAILAGHDVIMLGERGQGKSRLIRHMASLLDDESPAIAGCEVNDHPYRPICARCRDLVAGKGDEVEITWVGRDSRFSEKLATPDTSVADLIGDVDPIRVAEGRHLGDEMTIHYGLVPRTNRGIFAVNELPDLPERIQVALLNILEERDVQIRGYKIRLPLDLMLVASANPEDYTHRGRIISPLKDRFGSQVRTHYPERIEDEMQIIRQEAAPPPGGARVVVAPCLEEVIAELTAHLRASAQVNQHSGVSVRFSIGAYEMLIASALRRAILNGEADVVPRVVDLWAILPAAIGRVELDTLEEGREGDILARALRRAILQVWQRRMAGENLRGLVARFEEGLAVETSEVMPAGELLAQIGPLPSVARVVERLGLAEESQASVASAIEFCLEGLHLTRRINKHESATGRWRFRGQAE